MRESKYRSLDQKKGYLFGTSTQFKAKPVKRETFFNVPRFTGFIQNLSAMGSDNQDKGDGIDSSMDKESVFGFQILILRGIEEPEGVRLVMKDGQLEEGLNSRDILTVVFSKRINAVRHFSTRVHQRKG